MRLAHYCYNLLSLLLIIWGASGCLAISGTTPVVEPPKHSPESTHVIPTAPNLGVTPTPIIASTMTPLIPPTNLQLVQVTDSFTAGVFWAENGQTLIYASREQPGQEWTWWQYEIATGEQHPTVAPFQITPQLWKELEFYEHKENFAVWDRDKFSPSGTYILYTRLPSDYTHKPGDFSLPPYEAWIARTDGSQAVLVQSNCRVIQALWRNQETQVIFTCSVEGGWADIWLAEVDGSNTYSLSSVVFGGQYNNDWMALSPNETKLAFVDNLFHVRIAALDGSENIGVEAPCEFTFRPNWSTDGQRIYFKCQGLSRRDDGVYVYDLRKGTITRFIALPLVLDDGREADMAEMIISPCETGAVFISRGLWLITWMP